MQDELFAAARDLPAGFRYKPDLITPEEEARLAGRIAGLPLKPFEFRGYLGSRRVATFGYRYDYTRRAVESAAPLPEMLLPLRQSVALFSGRPAQDFVQALVTEYAPGAPIGWHRDKKEFGDIVGVSLSSPARLRFRRRIAQGWERRDIVVQPCSAYLLSAEAREVWEHSIPPQETLRYSITFRTLAAA